MKIAAKDELLQDFIGGLEVCGEGEDNVIHQGGVMWL